MQDTTKTLILQRNSMTGAAYMVWMQNKLLVIVNWIMERRRNKMNFEEYKVAQVQEINYVDFYVVKDFDKMGLMNLNFWLTNR